MEADHKKCCTVPGVGEELRMLHDAIQSLYPLHTMKSILLRISPHLPKTASRNFHASVTLSAPKGKGKGKGSSDESESVALPQLGGFSDSMDKRIDRLQEEFSKLRAGRASTDILSSISIPIENAKFPLLELAQVNPKGANSLHVMPFDKALLSAICAGIKDCGLNLSPTVDGDLVNVPIPKPSAEAREQMAKLASKSAEKTKTEVRGIRKDAIDSMKKLKGSTSEDDTKRFTKEVDALVEKKLALITKIHKDKEAELLGK